MEATSGVVSAADLERLLKNLETPAGAHGIFAPNSASWKINRESALFLAAGRATLLQLAHPWVATAIAEHSRTLYDPVGRFHRTVRTMFAMTFGTVEQAKDAARHLHRRHAGIRGRLPQDVGCFPAQSEYLANDLAALVWVSATLIDSTIIAYELVLPPLTAAEREQYYEESRRTAALFGIPRECLPENWRAFGAYMQSMLQSNTLAVSDATCAMAQRLQAGAGRRIRTPFWYRALTARLMPAHLRHEFRLVYGERERRSAERAMRWLRRVYPRLPATLRFVGPYNEVCSRLNGRLRPSLAVRLSNRLWIGGPSLLDLEL